MTTRGDGLGGLWCPKCGVEYRPGFTACADCFVPLVDVQPEPASFAVVAGFAAAILWIWAQVVTRRAAQQGPQRTIL